MSRAVVVVVVIVVVVVVAVRARDRGSVHKSSHEGVGAMLRGLEQGLGHAPIRKLES